MKNNVYASQIRYFKEDYMIFNHLSVPTTPYFNVPDSKKNFVIAINGTGAEYGYITPIISKADKEHPLFIVSTTSLCPYYYWDPHEASPFTKSERKFTEISMSDLQIHMKEDYETAVTNKTPLSGRPFKYNPFAHMENFGELCSICNIINKKLDDFAIVNDENKKVVSEMFSEVVAYVANANKIKECTFKKIYNLLCDMVEKPDHGIAYFDELVKSSGYKTLITAHQITHGMFSDKEREDSIILSYKFMQDLLTDDFVEFTSEDTIDDIFRTYAGDEAIILNSTVNSENYDILNAILIEQLFRYTLKSENNQYHYIFNKLDKMGYIEAFYTFVDCFNKGKISNVDIITAHVDDLKKKYNLQYSGDDMINNLINRMDSFLLMGTNRESDREYFRKYAEKDKLLKKQFEHSQTVPDECCVIKQNVYPRKMYVTKKAHD